MPKQYIMRDSTGQTWHDVDEDNLEAFLDKFPGAIIIEEIEDEEEEPEEVEVLEEDVPKEESDKQKDLSTTVDSEEEKIKKELSKHDTSTELKQKHFEQGFQSIEQRDSWLKTLNDLDREAVESGDFGSLSQEAHISLLKQSTAEQIEAGAIGGFSDLMKGDYAAAWQKTPLGGILTYPGKIAALASSEIDEYSGVEGGAYQKDLDKYLKERDPNKVPTGFLDGRMGGSLMGKEEEEVVPAMRELYRDYGFEFGDVGIGDAMIVRTKDGEHEIEINLDNWTDAGDREQALKLKTFLDTYAGEYAPLAQNDERAHVIDFANNMHNDLVDKTKETQGKWDVFKIDRGVTDEDIFEWDNTFNEDVVNRQKEELNNGIIDLNKTNAGLKAQQNTFNNEIAEFREALDTGDLSPEEIQKRQKELLVEQKRLNSEHADLKVVYERDIAPLEGALNIITGKQYVIDAAKGNFGAHTGDMFVGILDNIGNFGEFATMSLEELKLEEEGVEPEKIREITNKRFREIEVNIKEAIGSDVTEEYANEFDQSIAGGVYRAGVEMVGMFTTAALTGPAAPYTFQALMGAHVGGGVLEEMSGPEWDDVSFKERLGFASAVGAVVGTLEKVGATKMGLFKGKKGSGNLIQELTKIVFKKTAIKAGTKKLTKAGLQKVAQEVLEDGIKKGTYKIIGGKLIKGVLGEGLTEATQEVVEIKMKDVYNDVKDEEKFKGLAEQLTFENIAKVFTIGGITGGLFGGISGIGKAYKSKVIDKLSNKQYLWGKALINNNELAQAYSAKLMAEIQNPTSTQSKAKAEKELRTLRALGGIYQQVSGLGLTTEGEKRAFTLLQKKAALQKQLDGLPDKAIGKRQREEITAIDKQLEDISTTYNFESAYQRGLVEAEEKQKLSKKGFNILKTDEEFKAKMEEFGLEDIEVVDGKKVDGGFKNTGGYIDTEGNIWINDAAARRMKEISVGQHELLHGIVGKQIGSVQPKMVQEFVNYMSKKEQDAVKGRLKEVYGEDIENATSEEWFNAMVDGVVQGDIKYNENVFTKMGEWIVKNILRPVGWGNAQLGFKNGKQVYNFVKDYAKQSRQIAYGLQEGYEGEVGDIVAEGTTESKPKGQFSKREATTLAKQYKDGTIDPDQIENFIKQYHNLGLKAMGFDRAKGDISSEDAISFLNSEFDSIMRNYDGSTEFSTYVTNVIPKRAVKFYEEQIGDKAKTISTDSDTARQIAAEETETKDTRSEREIRQAERKGIKVKEKIPGVYDVDKVVKAIKDKAKGKDFKGKTIKQLKGFALEEISMMISRDEALGKSIYKKILNNSDLNKVEMLAIQKFINADVDLVKGSLLEGYTSEFKATGVVRKLLEAFYNKRSIRAKTGPGLEVQIKKPNISDSEVREAFGIIGRDPSKWNQKVVASKGGVSDILKGFVRSLDQAISSQEIREQLIKDGQPDQALSTLKDGMPSGYFTKRGVENLGRSFNELGKIDGAQETFLGGLSQFIELINAGMSVDTAFMNTYPAGFLDKKNKKPLDIKKVLINNWKTVVLNFYGPQTDFNTGKPSDVKLNEYLYQAFDEQTNKEVVQNILGIEKGGIDWRDPDQVSAYVSFIKEYFGDLYQEFDNDLDFFKYVIQHFENTFTSAAKIGGLPNHTWVNGKLVEGKSKGKGTGVRYGVFNNRTEFYEVLLKSFDTENKLKPIRGGFSYDGEIIKINRAPQSNIATKKYLEEFKRWKVK